MIKRRERSKKLIKRVILKSVTLTRLLLITDTNLKYTLINLLYILITIISYR